MTDAPRYLTLTGDVRLAYSRAPGAAPEVLFLSGFSSDMSGTKALFLEAACARLSVAYTRFDYRGHGRSSGAFEDGTIGLWRDDALSILDRVCEHPLLLVGSSMGGWIMLLAALARSERVLGLIGLAAAPDFTERLVWQGMTDDERAAFLRDRRHVVPSAYGPEPTVYTADLIEEARAHLLLARPIPLACPTHLIQGLTDPDVPWRTSIDLAQALAAEDVTVELVKDGDHRLSRPEDLARLGAALERMVARIRDRL